MLFSDIKRFVLERRLSGKRPCFMWDDEGLDGYIKWAFVRNNLLYASNENGISGVAVAYALPKPFDGPIENLLPYDELVEPENDKELVVMDWIADEKNARTKLVSQFKQRFPNWQNQKKWGVHYGHPKVLSNKYIQKIETYQWEQE